MGGKAFAAVLMILGTSSILANGAAIVVSGQLPVTQVALGLVYGAAGAAAGVLLWKCSASARKAYIAWCVTIALYPLAMPELLTLYMLPGFVAAALMLWWGYRYISRHVGQG